APESWRVFFRYIARLRNRLFFKRAKLLFHKARSPSPGRDQGKRAPDPDLLLLRPYRRLAAVTADSREYHQHHGEGHDRDRGGAKPRVDGRKRLTLRPPPIIVSDTLLTARTLLWPPTRCESTGSLPT